MTSNMHKKLQLHKSEWLFNIFVRKMSLVWGNYNSALLALVLISEPQERQFDITMTTNYTPENWQGTKLNKIMLPEGKTIITVTRMIHVSKGFGLQFSMKL